MQKAITTLCGLIAAGGLMLTLASPGVQSERRGSMEKSLLGIRVLDSYKKVFAKFGQPTRVYRQGETVLTISAYDADGMPTGGIKGLDDGNGNGGGGPMGGGGRGRGGSPGGMGGYPGMGGMPGGMGRPGGMGGMPDGMGGMPGMGGQGGFPGMGGQGGYPGGGMPGGMGGYPGMGGMPGGMGGMPPGGMGGPGGAPGGLGANNGQQQGNTFADSGGFMWVYHYPKQELLYWFVFNRDSRVVAIIEMGRIQGKPTGLGLKLGDPVKQIYSVYGWPDSTEMQNETTALHYNIRQHVQFNILNNKTVSIAVFLTEDQRAFLNAGNGGGNGGGGRGGFPGGGRGFPGGGRGFPGGGFPGGAGRGKGGGGAQGD